MTQECEKVAKTDSAYIELRKLIDLPADKMPSTQPVHYRLKDAKIALLRSEEVMVTKGKQEISKTAKPDESNRALHHCDFLIILSSLWWKLGPKAEARIAVLDHALCHCGAELDENDGTMKYVVKKHDFEGFVAVLDRHGKALGGARPKIDEPFLPWDGADGDDPPTATGKKGSGDGDEWKLGAEGQDPEADDTRKKRIAGGKARKLKAQREAKKAVEAKRERRLVAERTAGKAKGKGK